MDSYLQYLKQAYNRVVQLTLKDESLNVLSQMENKSYYFTRLHQLFNQMYSVERENKIKMLIQELQALRIRAVSEKSIYQPQRENIIENICQRCLSNSQIPNSQQHLQPQPQQTQTQTLHQTLKQNSTLSTQLHQTQQSHLQQITLLTTIHEQTQQKLTHKIDTLTNNLQEIQRRYKELRGKYQAEVKVGEELRAELVREREERMKLAGKLREVERDWREKEDGWGRVREEVVGLRQAKDILEENIARLEDAKAHLKNKLEIYQKQLKSISTQKQSNTNSPLKLNLSQEDSKKQDLNSLISVLTTKQMQIKRLTSQKFSLDQQNSNLRRELSDYKANTERSLSQLKQNFNRIKLDYQKQLRSYRQNQKSNLLQLKKLQQETKQSHLHSQSQKLQTLESTTQTLTQKLTKSQHTNQILLQNYQQITQAFRQEKQAFDKKIEQCEIQLENYKRMEKEWAKRSQVRDTEARKLEQELRDKIGYMDGKIGYLEAEVGEGKKREDKLLAKVQKYQAEIRNSSVNQTNQKLVLREHQLTLRISQLQHLIEQNKNAAKQLLDKKQQKIKSIRKQLQGRDGKIIEIETQLEKQTNEKENYKMNLRETELLLRKQQQRIMQIQQKHRNEILQMIKNFDIKTKQLTQQLTKHFSPNPTSNPTSYPFPKSTPNSSLTQSLRQLEQQHRTKLKSLQSQLSGLKSKNIVLEDKVKQYQYRLKIGDEEARKYREDVGGLREKLRELEGVGEEQKNRQVQIIKYYEDKINTYKNIFREFKFQICQQFLTVTTSLKTQLTQLKKQSQKSFQTLSKALTSTSLQLHQKITSYQSTTIRKYQSETSKLYQQKLIKHERQKQQLIAQYENKLKEKCMDMMTITAEKEFILEEIKESQNVINRKYKELEGSYNKLVAKMERNQKNQLELKEIIMKMEAKVNQAQRNSMIKEKEVYQLEKMVEELTQKLEKTDKIYKLEIKECRQKYRQQNQKIFNKYQRQFNKILVLNSKKTKDRPSLTSIMSARGISIPTKGNNNEQDKIEKLKRQIQEQKKLVQEMESMKKC